MKYSEEMLMRCTFLPGVTLEEISLPNTAGGHVSLLQNMCTEKLIQGGGTDLVYLSPDADERLNPNHCPPMVVVVGMLVDRKVQPNRSKLRAQEVQNQTKGNSYDEKVVEIQVKRLPLDALRAVDLNDDEPLNIDTVMELMERWWRNVKVSDGDDILLSSDCVSNKPKLFTDAAIRALHTHRERHPNRTIHGGLSTTMKQLL